MGADSIATMAPALLGPPAMGRRLSALLAIVVIVGLVLALMWTVYRHHEGIRAHDEPAIVSLPSAPA